MLDMIHIISLTSWGGEGGKGTLYGSLHLQLLVGHLPVGIQGKPEAIRKF